VFSVIGAPTILQSDNGSEFVNAIFASIASLWGSKQVHGRPHHPQSQGSVENINGRVKAVLQAWIVEAEKNGFLSPSRWHLGLKFVQFRLNTR
jgi:transposase InsO family protein